VKKISFNKPYLTGNEMHYIEKSVLDYRHISGNGEFTKKCQRFFEERYGFKKALLTTSCTDALEMAAILINIKPNDEVIMPSFTFVSTANAFILRGAKIIFADSEENTPNIDTDNLEGLINDKTKAIVVVHYAGVACEMDKIMQIANKHNLYVIEDAAQAIDSYYNDKPLGSIGHLSTFSFHETKNIQSGEGGLLVINDEQFIKRAELIWEKGTNRAAFFRGEIDKYGWVDIGSSFLPSDMIAAYLFAQLEKLDEIQQKRKDIWNLYFKNLKELRENGTIKLPVIPDYATNNAHMFYMICNSNKQRTELIKYLKSYDTSAIFHYQSLHLSDFYFKKHDNRELSNCIKYSDTILRLPMYFELTEKEVIFITIKIKDFFNFNCNG
jgi:dTDP-4-amino-4,6-dideoxygalactose transaminase